MLKYGANRFLKMLLTEKGVVMR